MLCAEGYSGSKIFISGADLLADVFENIYWYSTEFVKERMAH